VPGGNLTIRDLDAYATAAWDWSCLDGCFGRTRIAACDVDGVIEKRGNFLIIETKRPGANMKAPQRQALDRLAKLPGVWVLIMWGLPGAPRHCIILHGAEVREYNDCDLPRVRAWVARWYAHAQANPAPMFATERKPLCPTTRTTTAT